ncbi:MAG TPA: PPC domain-containing protein [Candidatus Hydrogenedentes bacterium]|nr:PPC domain-containing protein [Candidatus Hydrogenedentota bacterium]HRT20586.1 PPC domain-containing protein [Candidatus Hydrogenedentota bacterium]HRT65407.1 PPC domain-containing protein [Candidatus Hydrogenedentota bacterium]
MTRSTRRIQIGLAGRHAISLFILPAILAWFMAYPAWGQSGEREPHIGYLYPAGGQQGTTVQVLVGGQRLGGARSVHVSGAGVSATVLQYSRPLNNDQLKEVRKLLGNLVKLRRSGKTVPAFDLPEHPLLRNVDRMSLRELEHWIALRLNSAKKQQNMQLADMALLEITIAADAKPGRRELRLGTGGGLTNPLRFEVGGVVEVCEKEPNDRDTVELGAVDIPAVLNGQIMPGDVDRFRFRAQQGQQLVFTVQARALIPYLADAVPGWFQPVLALHDAQGRELAFADDYRFDPDPVFFHAVPESGEYEVEIRDSIYRGRDDFVYRIIVGEQPFITRLHPLGGRTGMKITAEIGGWNLPEKEILLDTAPGGASVRETALYTGPWRSNPIRYAVDNLPEMNEREPNDTLKKARKIDPPRIVNGRIAHPGDVDTFQFKTASGGAIVAEICARRLHSPVDSVLQLFDASGTRLATNDDWEDKGEGLLTHHADSYLRADLPKAGVYYVQVEDAQRQGGAEYGYRLRLGPPRPDFALRMTPSSVTFRASRTSPLTVYALRKDGFAGEIGLRLKEAPPGFKLEGARIPPGCDQVRMTITATQPFDSPAALELEGVATIGNETVVRPVTPCENMMQAFAYWHLTPTLQLLATAMGGKGRPPRIEAIGETPVRIPEGGSAQVSLRVPQAPMLEGIKLELSDPPKGIALQETISVPGKWSLVLKADAEAVKAGYADNLIVEAVKETAPPPKTKKNAKAQRVSLGVLPAIPFEIVSR